MLKYYPRISIAVHVAALMLVLLSGCNYNHSKAHFNSDWTEIGKVTRIMRLTDMGADTSVVFLNTGKRILIKGDPYLSEGSSVFYNGKDSYMIGDGTAQVYPEIK